MVQTKIISDELQRLKKNTVSKSPISSVRGEEEILFLEQHIEVLKIEKDSEMKKASSLSSRTNGLTTREAIILRRN